MTQEPSFCWGFLLSKCPVAKVRLAALGREVEAKTEIDRVQAESSEDPEVWLVGAIANAMANRRDQALFFMRQAAKMGVTEARLREETVLRGLVQDLKGGERTSIKKP